MILVWRYNFLVSSRPDYSGIYGAYVTQPLDTTRNFISDLVKEPRCGLWKGIGQRACRC
jgi:hypothetical protein